MSSRGFAVDRTLGTLKGAVRVLPCLLFLLFPLHARSATEQHLFDPRLSLTGTCSTDEADSVPDPWCPGPPGPSAKFENPNITIDAFGDMYVSSSNDAFSTGRIDVFSPEGQFITHLSIPDEGVTSLAVDPKGNLYVNETRPGTPHKVSLYRPSAYDPDAEEIAYGNPGEVIIEGEDLASPCSAKSAGGIVSLAIDPVTEHLFVSPGDCVAEWSSASSAGGPELLDPTIGASVLGISQYIAVDHAHNRIYVAEYATEGSTSKDIIQVFELGAPHTHLGTLDGHVTPSGKFLVTNGWDTMDVDETSGNLLVSEMLVSPPVVYEFGSGLGAGEELLNTYKYAGFKSGGPYEVAVDNAPTSSNFRSIYVPSRGTSLSHAFAFRFSEVGEPEIASAGAAGITESEAVLNATINPGGGEAKYRIEYTAPGSSGAVLAAAGTLPAGLGGIPVSAPVNGLAPGTSYQFRVFVENEVGTDVVEGTFRTYAPSSIGGPCPTDSLRTGFSANLPDCRAYELVSPANTNGLTPLGAGTFGAYFPTLHAAPDGQKASFRIEGGVIPGFEGAGSTNGENYVATRGIDGWTTEYAGGSGTEAVTGAPGGFSPDQGYNFWEGPIEPGEGIAVNPFLRYPDGHSERVGRGSLGVDPNVEALLISKGAAHTIFRSVNVGGKAIRLEPNAPPTGTPAIYDRTVDENTHVVSLLPGNITPAASEEAIYVGASLDGEGVAFELSGSNVLYLRLHNTTTYEVGENLTFAGITEGGGTVFYLKSGNLFRFDTASKSSIQFSKGGDTTPVNISPDGSTAYFISPDVLTGKKANPSGEIAQGGEDNLYVSRMGELSFVGTVEPLDVGESFGSGEELGLGQWVPSQERGLPGLDTSRTTPDGRVLIFESGASLTGYESDGHKQIYRYDATAATLVCLSCNPTGAPATGEASLETIPRGAGEQTKALGLADRLLNVRPDGNRAFFQSYEPLVVADGDGKQDVYEWEAQGVGSCSDPAGCVYLITSGQSDRDEYLFAVSESGDDAFFLSGSLLVGSDSETTSSLYDARVGGGFSEGEAPAPCEGDGCRGALTPSPLLPTPATPKQAKSGNVSPRCPKGKRRVKRHGKVRCVKKRHHHRHHHASPQGRGSK